ncbi:MAG TPA: hypothetical protein VMQ62_02485 [Dongiaceae bacterium]|nr:hypothetical protein [Dongiaceae bacterium]
MFGLRRKLRRDLRAELRLAFAMARGGAMMQARRIDPTDPGTWEFSGFSQNGEDGILDVLRRHLVAANRYCVEIGASDGLENNTAWLLLAEQYAGLLIEGDPGKSKQSRRLMQYGVGIECHPMFVTRESATAIRALAWRADPDVFSLDIDGMDYHVAEALLEGGFRPAIFVAEYNAVFGPERSMTVAYRPDFDAATAHPTSLAYGVSIAAWRKLFERRGYRFVTVNRHGVNAFFVDPERLDAGFLAGVRGLPYAENIFQYRKFHRPSEAQFALIADQPFVTV